MTRGTPRTPRFILLIPSAVVAVGCLQRAEACCRFDQRWLTGKLADKASSL